MGLCITGKNDLIPACYSHRNYTGGVFGFGEHLTVIQA